MDCDAEWTRGVAFWLGFALGALAVLTVWMFPGCTRTALPRAELAMAEPTPCILPRRPARCGIYYPVCEGNHLPDFPLFGNPVLTCGIGAEP